MPTVKELMQKATVICMNGGESIRVDHCDETDFTGTGEETGVGYCIDYADIDINAVQIYGLVQLN